jgi:hypothetical protein
MRWPSPSSASTRPNWSKRSSGRGAGSTTSRSPPPSGSTGSTIADRSSTAETSPRSKQRLLTTLTTRPQQQLESQTRKSPDLPGRFSARRPRRSGSAGRRTSRPFSRRRHGGRLGRRSSAECWLVRCCYTSPLVSPTGVTTELPLIVVWATVHLAADITLRTARGAEGASGVGLDRRDNDCDTCRAGLLHSVLSARSAPRVLDRHVPSPSTAWWLRSWPPS